MPSRARNGFPRIFAGAALVVAFVPSAFAQYPGSQPVPKDLRKGFSTITVDEAKKWLGYLAGPECEGRGTGEPGYQKAAEYVAARFKEMRLKPVGDNGTYFQGVPFGRTKLDDAASYIEVGGKRLASAGSFGFSRGARAIDGSGGLVVVRATSEDMDLASLLPSLKGKFVMFVGANPNASIRADLRNAGVLASISLADAPPSNDWARGGGRFGIPNIVMTKTTAGGLVAGAGLDKALVDATTIPEGKVESSVSSTPARVVMKIVNEQVVPNVVGLLEGSDKTLKAEIIGIGAHLDHLGKSADGTIYYGADDDGSGSTALLAVAKALTTNPVKPKRSVLFMAFCGEEKGLVGSGYYTDNPIFPHDRMFCELQMDMVGRDSDGVQNGDRNRVDKASENVDTIRLVGSKRLSQELDDIIQAQNKYINFRFKYDAEDVYTRSDHYNFAKNGIPIAFLFDGFHPDYHRPTDTVDKINFVKLTNAAKLYYLTIHALSGMDRPLLRNGTDVEKKGASGG